jgi:hypothetical protein
MEESRSVIPNKLTQNECEGLVLHSSATNSTGVRIDRDLIERLGDTFHSPGVRDVNAVLLFRKIQLTDDHRRIRRFDGGNRLLGSNL